ncbi:MAG: hypothetical protein ACOYUZ_02025 [Patescibacteria group bacterium]
MLVKKVRGRVLQDPHLIVFFKALIAPVLLFVFHIIAIHLGFYAVFHWFDIPMHFAGGLLIGISAAYLVIQAEKRFLIQIHSLLVRILFIVMGVALIAMLWEISEFMFDLFLHTELQSSIPDTMFDMILGLLGGFISAFFYSLYYHPKLRT